MNSRTPFVLVHGAWLGGWCWNYVRPLLEKQGHRVFTPTLTGLGERAHLREPVPSLETHVLDVVGLLESEELSGVTLVGHSWGGMVITAVADRMKDRIAHLVYLDAAVPADGADFAAHIPGIEAEFAERRRAAFRQLSPDGVWLPVMGPEAVGVTAPQDADWLRRRMTPHPLRTWFDAVRFSSGGHSGIRKTYVLATQPLTAVMGYPAQGEVAKRGGEWSYREIATGHSMMVTEPTQTADLLLEAAGAGAHA
jgi:pimeloyl-ACP methyl ester carboxylesterase